MQRSGNRVKLACCGRRMFVGSGLRGCHEGAGRECRRRLSRSSCEAATRVVQTLRISAFQGISRLCSERSVTLRKKDKSVRAIRRNSMTTAAPRGLDSIQGSRVFLEGHVENLKRRLDGPVAPVSFVFLQPRRHHLRGKADKSLPVVSVDSSVPPPVFLTDSHCRYWARSVMLPQ